MRGAALVLVLVGCARALTPAEQEFGLVARVAEYQSCASTVRISRRSEVYHYRLGGTPRTDGSISYPRSAWYDIKSCTRSSRLHTLCGEDGAKLNCSYDIGDGEFHATGWPPPRTRLVAEVVATFDHARPMFACPLLDASFAIDRRVDDQGGTYHLAACGTERAFRVTCPDHESIDPDDCSVEDR